jgi:hypothetical protein
VRRGTARGPRARGDRPRVRDVGEGDSRRPPCIPRPKQDVGCRRGGDGAHHPAHHANPVRRRERKSCARSRDSRPHVLDASRDALADRTSRCRRRSGAFTRATSRPGRSCSRATMRSRNGFSTGGLHQARDRSRVDGGVACGDRRDRGRASRPHAALRSQLRRRHRESHRRVSPQPSMQSTKSSARPDTIAWNFVQNARSMAR